MCCVYSLWTFYDEISPVDLRAAVKLAKFKLSPHVLCVLMYNWDIESYIDLALLSSFRIQTDSLTKTEQQLFFVNVIALCVMDRDCFLVALCKSWIWIKGWLRNCLCVYLILISFYPILSSPQSLCLEHWQIIKLKGSEWTFTLISFTPGKALYIPQYVLFNG